MTTIINDQATAIMCCRMQYSRTSTMAGAYSCASCSDLALLTD
ncbi:MAG: hypothetical protein Q4D31_01750 [Eubacteriales bacterium]|nr:hypothetical protein [Eubacteriales bacterium]